MPELQDEELNQVKGHRIQLYMHLLWLRAGKKSAGQFVAGSRKSWNAF